MAVYCPMKNLVEALCATGLSECEAKKALAIVYQWVDSYFPVMAALAKATVLKEAELGEGEAITAIVE